MNSALTATTLACSTSMRTPGEGLPGLAPDWIIEIDNKSLTHRPDLWGHYGMAREVAAIAAGNLMDPVKPGNLPQGAPKLSCRN